jgi:hypothetical protein
METSTDPITIWFSNPAPLSSGTSTEVTWTFSENGDSGEERKEWEGVLAVIGHPTADRRYLIPDEISHRDLPLPFLVQTATEDGHRGAEVAGRIEKITHIPAAEFERGDEFALGELREGAVIVFAEGTLDGSGHENDAVRMIENGAGVSVDLPPDRVAPFDAETFEELDPKEISFEDMLFGDLLTGIGGKIAAATIVSIPAFEEASVVLVDSHALVASAYGIRLRKPTVVLTASAAGLAPLKPPTSWFYREEPNEPTPLTVTAEGQVYGHLALWDQCHAAFASCERPPRSSSEYAYFHVGQIESEEGDLVNVGRITVGEAGRARGGHASLILGRQGAMEHYDQSGCVGAFVRARDGKYGIWLSGAVRSDAPAERVRDLRANPPSGDWRNYELVGVLSVPVPGFPIPRPAEARLVATAAGEEEVAVLIATAHTSPVVRATENGGSEVERWEFPCESEPLDMPTYRQKMRELSARRTAAVEFLEEGPWLDDFQVSSEVRKRAAKTGAALPDGSFPITKCRGEGPSAENAIRAQGRADPGKRGRVRAHIRKRVRALGCSGGIFEPYK